MVDEYAGALKALGIPTYHIRRVEAEDRTKPGLRVATMHRVKGLEFDHVFIVGVNDGVVPMEGEYADDGDEVSQQERTALERALLYVSATRAKQDVTVTAYGRKSSFLDVHA